MSVQDVCTCSLLDVSITWKKTRLGGGIFIIDIYLSTLYMILPRPSNDLALEASSLYNPIRNISSNSITDSPSKLWSSYA